MASTFFLKPLVTIPLAPLITAMITYFVLHIPNKLSYFIFYPSFFPLTFLSACITTFMSMHVFSFSFLIITYIWPIFCIFPLSVYHLIHNPVTPLLLLLLLYFNLLNKTSFLYESFLRKDVLTFFALNPPFSWKP